MADRGNKDSTPPPLLLMPAGGGLTLNPPDNQNFLMPVIQSEPSLLDSEEEGEADSFVGQVPEPSNNPFHSASGGVDPFANVGHNPFPPQPQPSSVPQRFNHQTPPVRSSPIPGGPLTGQMSGMGIPGMSTPGQIPRQSGPPPPGSVPQNAFRRQDAGKMRYAMLPDTLTPVPGSYQSPQPRFTGPSASPLPPSPFSPPVAQVAPTMSSSGYNSQPTTGYNSQPQTEYNIPSQSDFGSQQPSGYYNLPQSAPYNTGEQAIYQPVTPHWCYSKRVELKECWYTFSLVDSMKLEEAYNSGNTCHL